MNRTSSFSNETFPQNKNDINEEEKMFFSMKEILHNPLQTIKSKELLNCIYKDKENSQKDDNDKEIIEIEKNKIIQEKYVGRNIFLSKYKIEEKEKSNSEMIDYNTSPNTHNEENSDKIIISEKINNIKNNVNTEPLNDNQKNNYTLREKNAMNEIKKLAQKIKNQINTFQICENVPKVSLEKNKNSNIMDNNYNCNLITNNNVKYRKLPFEFINYSISDITNDTKKDNNNDNDNYMKNTNAKIKINNIKTDIHYKENRNKPNQNNSNNKKKKKNNNYNYRNYIKNSPDIQIRRPDGDIYTREMEFKRKKELKLEQIRQKEMEEEMSELQYRPKINNMSKKMTKNKTPIYKRLKEIETEKNNKLEKIKENINKNNYTSNKNKQNENWNVKKIIKINNIKKEAKMDEELNDDYPFIPKINKNSEKIFKENHELSKVPVSDRLCFKKDDEEGCTHRKKNEEKLTFVPKINKYYPISDKYYEFMERDQFEIYNKNMQRNFSNV